MKTLVLAFFILSLGLNAQTAKLDSVKLFLEGAEMYHSVVLDLKKGTHEYEVEGISDNIVDHSIRVIDFRDGFIQTIDSYNDYLDKPKTTRFQELIDSLRYEIDLINTDRSSLEAEIKLINSTTDIMNNKNSKISSEDIINLSELYRTRLPGLQKELLKHNRTISKLNDKISDLQSQINSINGTNTFKKKIKFVIEVDQDQSSKITFTFLTFQAKWRPIYNFKINSEGSSKLDHIAEIFNNTSIDWKDIAITFSSRLMAFEDNIPVLSAHRIGISRPYNTEQLNDSELKIAPTNSVSQVVTYTANVTTSGKGYSVRGSRDNSEPVNTNYNINRGVNSFQSEFELKPEARFSIEADVGSKEFRISTRDIEPEFKWITVPIKTKKVYLMALVDNLIDLDIIPGKANIYYNNSFINSTSINNDVTTNYLEISLGQDRNVIVERIQEEDFTEEKTFSNDKMRTFGVKINIRNNKSREIDIIIKDQVPISTTEQVEVTIKDEKSLGAELDSQGILKWEEKVDASSNLTKQYYYTITWPRDKDIYPPIIIKDRKKIK